MRLNGAWILLSGRFCCLLYGTIHAADRYWFNHETWILTARHKTLTLLISWGCCLTFCTQHRLLKINNNMDSSTYAGCHSQICMFFVYSRCLYKVCNEKKPNKSKLLYLQIVESHWIFLMTTCRYHQAAGKYMVKFDDSEPIVILE